MSKKSVFPEVSEQAKKAALKDDCFDLPVKGTPEYDEFQRYLALLDEARAINKAKKP